MASNDTRELAALACSPTPLAVGRNRAPQLVAGFFPLREAHPQTDWRFLAMEALKAMQLNIARKAFIQVRDVKYIDPTYMIRATETNPSDKMYCQVLAQGAVHGAFAGFTGITVGVVNNHAAYLPIELVVSAPRVVDTRGKTWERLIDQRSAPLPGPG